MRWLNHLLDRHGSGAWCLTVDVDEVLAYPHAEFLGLKQLTAHLDRQGAQGLFTFMLDMYAEGSLHDVAYRPGDNPLALCPCFDRAGYIHREHPDFPFKMIAGGLVSRFLYDRKQDGVFLHKVPLVRWQEELRYTSSTHTLYPIALAPETGVLLHFKFIADFIDRARIEAERKQYWQGAKRYTEFSRRMQAADTIDFRCDLTERFVSTAQLVELGLVETTPALDGLAARLGAPRSIARLAGRPMIGTCAPVAVVLPCRNSRHLLWRSLASVAAQSLPPAQILVLDRSSDDGLGDWLRACWPGVELRTVPADADGAAIGAAISTAGLGADRRHAAPRRSLAQNPSRGAARQARHRGRRARADGHPRHAGTGAAALPWPADDRAVALAASTGGGDRVPAGLGGGDPARPARGRRAGRAARPARARRPGRVLGPKPARAEPRRPRLAGAGRRPAVRTLAGQPVRARWAWPGPASSCASRN